MTELEITLLQKLSAFREFHNAIEALCALVQCESSIGELDRAGQSAKRRSLSRF
jgi:hypothetical protein